MDEEPSTTNVDFAKGKVYGVLRARVTADNGEDHSHKTDMSHYNLITTDDGQTQTLEQYQINIDIQSLQLANVKCVLFDPLSNISLKFSQLPYGFTPLQSNSGDTIALDLVRRPLFDLNLLIESPSLTADQIANKLDVYLKQGHPNVVVFGTKYDDKHGPDPNHHYGKQRTLNENKPSRGIDDVHLNQIVGKTGDAYQDGALFIQKEGDDEEIYAAFFFCFANQCKTTTVHDDVD